MPIRDLTDKPRARLPRLGQLRKGAPKPKNSDQPGLDLTYFRFVCGDPSIVSAFADAYPKEPRVVNVLLPYPTLEENLSTWREEHGSGSLKHRCDGEVMVLWQDGDGVYHTDPKPCPYKDLPKGDKGRKCTETGELFVIIPELGRWGYIQVVTGSIWDCLELTDNMAAIEELAQRVSIMTGRSITMQGIPCLLKREPRMVSTPNKGKPRVRREKWLLHLEVHPDYLKRLAEMSRQFALPIAEIPQLKAPDLELDYDPGDNGDVEHPETEIVDEGSEAEPDRAEPTPGSNGKAKIATTSRNRGAQAKLDISISGRDGGLWLKYAVMLAEECEHYRDKDGEPNFNHIRAAAVKIGHPIIDSGNIEQVMRELKDRVTAPDKVEQEELPL